MLLDVVMDLPNLTCPFSITLNGFKEINPINEVYGIVQALQTSINIRLISECLGPSSVSLPLRQPVDHRLALCFNIHRVFILHHCVTSPVEFPGLLVWSGIPHLNFAIIGPRSILISISSRPQVTLMPCPFWACSVTSPKCLHRNQTCPLSASSTPLSIPIYSILLAFAPPHLHIKFPPFPSNLICPYIAIPTSCYRPPLHPTMSQSLIHVHISNHDDI